MGFSPSLRLHQGRGQADIRSHSLRSYQRQASSLRRWLELSQEEPRSEDQEAEQQVQEELQEVRPQAALGGALAVPLLSLAGPFLTPRWNCTSGSWLHSSRPGAGPWTPALPVSRPCGELCARGLRPPPGTECRDQVLFFYFKMLQLNELLFRSLPLFIQKYCATDTVEKIQMASPAGEIQSPQET